MKNLFAYKAERSNKAWLYLIPALIFIFFFSLVPLIRTFYLAFQSNSILDPSFVGFDNFVYVLRDPLFHRALKNTIIYSIVVVPLQMIIAMLIALILNSKIKGSKFFETIFFIPYLTSIIAIGVVFRYLFNGDYGIVNYVLGFLNIGPIDFLNDPNFNMVILCIFGIWNGMAFDILIMLSGLRSIDKSYYEIADMYGASSSEKFWKITIPQLIPILTFLTITNFISAFKVYGEVFALFNGRAGIGNSLMTTVFYIYNKFYVESRYGQGMAAAVIFFIFMLVFTYVERKILRKLSD